MEATAAQADDAQHGSELEMVTGLCDGPKEPKFVIRLGEPHARQGKVGNLQDGDDQSQQRDEPGIPATELKDFSLKFCDLPVEDINRDDLGVGLGQPTVSG
jgi:hypothetical protein